MTSDLEKLQKEIRQRMDPDNSLTLTEPQSVESTTFKSLIPPATRVAPAGLAVLNSQEIERRHRFSNWRRLAGKIGARYAACSLDNWIFHGEQRWQSNQRIVISQAKEYAMQLSERVESGTGVLLFGPPGTGKDFICVALMRAAVLQCGFAAEWANGVDLFAAFRDAIGGETTEKKLVSQWVSPQILCLSDPLPPRGVLTDFQASMLFRIIDGRYRANRPTWVTLNVKDREEACERMGSQVVSRLADGALTCRCEWPDFRATAKN